jgi:branched-chain amino acid transport system substrate-binding protein
MRVTKRLALTLSFVLGLGLSGQAARSQEIPIGVPMALTGPYAFVGVPIRNGIVLALEEANANGTLGAARIKIIGEDTASDKAQAISLTNRLHAADKVLMMLGPTSSIEGLAAAPVANDLKLPMLTSAVSGDILKAGPWSYKITAAPADIMTAFGRYAAENLKVKRAVFIFNRDNDGFVAQKNVMRDTMKSGGVEVISEEAILGSDTDFVALSTKLVASGADAIFIASPAEQGANIVIQARQAGLGDKVAILAPPSMASQAFIKTGGKAVEGATVVADYFAGAGSELNKAFIAAYQKKHSQMPDNWAAVGYALGSVAVQVLKIAGPGADRETVRAAFAKLGPLPTVLGNGTFQLDANRAPQYGAAIVTVKSGQFSAVQ